MLKIYINDDYEGNCGFIPDDNWVINSKGEVFDIEGLELKPYPFSQHEKVMVVVQGGS